MSAHTPGPWKVEPSRHGFAFDVRYPACDATIAMIYPPVAWVAALAPGREIEMVANAKLIAAAPALADALEVQRCFQCTPAEPDEDVCDACRLRRAALRAAGRL